MRERILHPMVNPLRNQQGVVEYYGRATSFFCIHIASSLAFRPTIWSSVLTWSGPPSLAALGNYGRSLILMGLDDVEEHFGPGTIAPEVVERLKQVRAQYETLATWDISSLSLEDTDAMVGVLLMATCTEGGAFRWRSCSGFPCVSAEDNILKMLSSTPMHDSPRFTSLGAAARSSGNDSRSPESILDDSLRRGGSSLQALRADISAKGAEALTASLASSDTESEADAALELNALAAEQASWTPPGVGYVASRQLIQRVRASNRWVVTF
jgi:hypothetical protein